MSKRIFLIAFIMMGFAFIVQAQDNGYATDTVVKVIEAPIEEVYEDEPAVYQITDTLLRVHAIDIDKDSIASWKRKKEFAYIHNLDSLLKASQEKKPKQSQPIPQGDSFMTKLLGGPVLKIILWTLAVFFVGIIVYQLIKSRGFFQRSSTTRVNEKPEEEDVLLLHDDFGKLIQQAVAIGDYRMAVRYQFLKTLQQLRDKNQINYEPDKTNSRYVYELQVNWRNDFSKLIFQYEYVWYGHFELNKDQYEQVQAGFQSFQQKV